MLQLVPVVVGRRRDSDMPKRVEVVRVRSEIVEQTLYSRSEQTPLASMLRPATFDHSVQLGEYRRPSMYTSSDRAFQ